MRNVVVLLCDQLRPDFLSIYGSEAVPTPNLDRLASMGVVFDNAITQSTVCAPARASMMTGRYVSDHGVWSNDLPFRDGMEYLAERMNDLGYRTGAFGKLHHYPAEDAKGFVQVRQMEEGRLGKNEPYLRRLKERHPEVDTIWNHEEYSFRFTAEEYYEHWIADEAMSFVSETAGTAPFLAWISFQGPHGPFDPPQEVHGTIDEAKLPLPLSRPSDAHIPQTVLYRAAHGSSRMTEHEQMRRRVAYAEMIACIDLQIGRILDHLETEALLANTTIIFSADHGDMLGDFGLDGKGPFPYPAQMDIPLIVANHPKIVPGERSKALVGNIDIPGTVLDIAGAERPIGHSQSLLKAAVADAPAAHREVMFSEFCDSVKTVDDGRYRYSFYPFQATAELYDRAEDPHFFYNLAGMQEYREIEIAMRGHVIDFLTLAKGVRMEAHDFVPASQRGLSRKDPDYQRTFPVVFPLSKRGVDRLRAAGCNTEYNEFCRDREVLRNYAQPYWVDGEELP